MTQIDPAASPAASMGTSPLSGLEPGAAAAAQQAAPRYEPPLAANLSPTERTELTQLSAAARGGNAAAAGKLERLENLYHAREMAKLSSDVYHYGLDQPGAAPEGWTRVSGNDAMLAGLNIDAELLGKGTDGPFRAEVYVPDPAVVGPNAKPVLALRGTAEGADWPQNLKQGSGAQAESYTKAMELAVKMNDVTDGHFEITGHSLGGGLASAGAAVTGAQTTTFNAAGLHAETANRFTAQFGGTVHDANAVIKAYNVDGEVLTSIQEGAVTPKRAVADVAATAAGGVVRAADNAVDFAQDLGGAVGEGVGDAAEEIGGMWGVRHVLGVTEGIRARAGDFVDRNTQDLQGAIGNGLDKLQSVNQSIDDAADGARNGDLHRDFRAFADGLAPRAAGEEITLAARFADGTARPEGPLVVEVGFERAPNGEVEVDVTPSIETVNRHLMPQVISSLAAEITDAQRAPLR